MLTKKKYPRFLLMLGILLVGTLIISACGSQQTPAATVDEAAAADEIPEPALEIALTEAPAETLSGADVEQPNVSPTDPPDVDREAQDEGYPAPGYQWPTPTTNSGAYPGPGEAAPPPVKTGLEATNPSTVVLASGKPQLVEFFAFWSSRCQALAPIVHGLEAEYYDEINFVYLDVDDPANASFKEQFDFRDQPQFFLLDGEGQVFKEWVGPIPREEFVAAFEEFLAQ